MSVETVSPTTQASTAFVAAHLGEATALGERVAYLVAEPDSCAGALNDGFAELADPAYVDGVKSVTPGLDLVFGVRNPLIGAVHKAFKRRTRSVPSAVLLDVYERLAREEMAEPRWFAMWSLEGVLPTDADRTWHLLQRFAREAHEWITVDTLAHPYGAGIMLDARRWAELEQLVHSPSRWERRLVGSTLATLPFQRRFPGSRDLAVAEHGLDLIGQLIGDAERDVQKALSWALRSLTLVDLSGVERFLTDETLTAAETTDGYRAWVIRDSVAKIQPQIAADLRARLEGIRRKPGAAPTSRAALLASEFLPEQPPEAKPRRRRAPERAHVKVSERGARAATPASPADRPVAAERSSTR